MTEIRRYTQTNIGPVPDERGIFALYDEAAAVVAELTRERDEAREAAGTSKMELMAKYYGASSACDILHEQLAKRDAGIAELEKQVGKLDEDAADLDSIRMRQFAEIEQLKASSAALVRELERWRHGQPIEGDYVCPFALETDRINTVLADTLRPGETLSEAIWRLKRYCADATEERDNAKAMTWERGRTLRYENLTLAAQVSRMREAIEVVVGVWEGAVCLDDPGCGDCPACNLKKTLALSPTALERYVRAAIAAAEYLLKACDPCGCDDLDRPCESCRIANAYYRAEAALEEERP